MKRCGALQHSVGETEPLAAQLYEHLVALQGSFAEAGAQLHSRLLLLQVWLVMVVFYHCGPRQEYKDVCLMILLLLLVVVTFSFALDTCPSLANRWPLSCSRLVMTAVSGMCSGNTTQLSVYVWKKNKTNNSLWCCFLYWGFYFSLSLSSATLVSLYFLY